MNYTDLLILGVLLAGYLLYRLHNYSIASRTKTAGNSGRQGSQAARELLLARGYQVVAVKKQYEFQAAVNGRTSRGLLQADFLVRKEGRLLAVRVEQTGEQAEPLLKAEGKYQLLQLQLLAGADGVLVVDLQNEKIHVITFKIKSTQRQKMACLAAFLCGTAASAVAALILFWQGGH